LRFLTKLFSTSLLEKNTQEEQQDSDTEDKIKDVTGKNIE